MKSISSIRGLLGPVKDIGDFALKERRKVIYLERKIKNDGSIATSTDKQVEEYLINRINRQFQDVNIISEETYRSFDPNKQYTFAIDPIDGTDVFSLGMSGWCVSIGLLNSQLQPIAGIIYAPQLDLLLFADIGKNTLLNNETIELSNIEGVLSQTTNIMVPGSIHTQLDLRKYPGKIRSIGSASLHLCFPIIYPGVFAAIETKRTHIWDIAGAHAINQSLGFVLEYIDGNKINYSPLLDGSIAGKVILSGLKRKVDLLKQTLSLL